MAQAKERVGVEQDTSIDHKADVFSENGIQVIQSLDGDEYCDPTICFEGNDEVWEQAIAIAKEYGFTIGHIRRTWMFYDGLYEAPEPIWEIAFYLRPSLRRLRR